MGIVNDNGQLSNKIVNIFVYRTLESGSRLALMFRSGMQEVLGILRKGINAGRTRD